MEAARLVPFFACRQFFRLRRSCSIFHSNARLTAAALPRYRKNY
ncbi:hypothetical protein M529_14480 [Sphingobium ummariense RL-3]|uniref:Uncharacterized protein n=1 Tax=Sphingobium ummariense RL-3 TaxID=1346791 RepID=T0J0N0_9SPHN|nr:hypothetical protein M529_14480 [Sphingobium ummariense RL-3]